MCHVPIRSGQQDDKVGVVKEGVTEGREKDVKMEGKKGKSKRQRNDSIMKIDELPVSHCYCCYCCCYCCYCLLLLLFIVVIVIVVVYSH